jgi:O-antigen/teichoic acid export membrane protein
MNLKETWLKVFQTSGIRFYEMLLGIGSLLITTRVLGPGGRGQVVAVQSWADFLHAIISLSLANSVFYLLKTRRTGDENDMFGTLAFSSGALYIVSIVVFSVLYIISPGVFGDVPFWFLFVGLLLMLGYQFWNKAAERFILYFDGIRKYNNIQFVVRTIGIVLLFLLVYVFPLEKWGYLISLVVPNMLIGLSAFWMFRHDYGLSPKLNKEQLRRAILIGSTFHFGSIAGMLISRTDAIMINYFTSAVDLGIYDIAVRLVAMADVLTKSVSKVLYVVVAQDDEKNTIRMLDRMMLQSFILVFVLIGFGIALGPISIRIIAGAEFEPAVPLFRMLIWTLIPRSFGSFLNVQLISKGRGKTSSSIAIGTALLNVAMNVVLIPRYGAIGAVYATLAAHFAPLPVKVILYSRIRRRIMES